MNTKSEEFGARMAKLNSIDHMIEIKALKQNLTEVKIGKLIIWYSYGVPIAYQNVRKITLITVLKDALTNTTGRHKNQINPNKKERLPIDRFVENLKDELQAEISLIALSFTMENP